MAINQIAFLKTTSANRTPLGNSNGNWQRHYCEYLIRDEADYQRHVDYVHVKPLKHGLVSRVKDWQHSTFYRYLAQSFYAADWCGDVAEMVGGDV